MRLTTLGLLAMIAAAGSHLSAQADERLFTEATESDDRLKELHHDAGDLCLRNPSRDVEVIVACKAMIIYGLALNERGWCHGHRDEANAEKRFRQILARSPDGFLARRHAEENRAPTSWVMRCSEWKA